jgi:hypothetical protein
MINAANLTSKMTSFRNDGTHTLGTYPGCVAADAANLKALNFTEGLEFY